jgi:ferredoxin-NADP reductase
MDEGHGRDLWNGVNATTEVRLTAIAYGATEINLFEFTPEIGAALAEPIPGAHIDLQLPNGMLRQYSLVTPLCTPGKYVIGVKRQMDGRGGSRWIHEQLKVGDRIAISAPRNHFPLIDADVPTVLLAGGIGITPIYSMYDRLVAADRAARLHYWCRSPEHALFADRLRADDAAHLHHSRDTMRAVLADLPERANVYCCGPQSMLVEVTSRLADRPGIELHLEHFHAASTPAVDAESGFSVSLARSGVELRVQPGQTILEALLEASIDVPYSCEEGVCGACETKLISGTALHRDAVYSAADHERRGTIMVCCSRARSDCLVLDL